MVVRGERKVGGLFVVKDKEGTTRGTGDHLWQLYFFILPTFQTHLT